MSSSKKLFTALGISLWVFAVIFSLFPIWPHIYYRLSPQASETLASTIAHTVIQDPLTIPLPSPTPLVTPPPSPDFDPSLPAKNGLQIDKIGVQGEIHEGENWQSILKQGIWRVPNFGTPDSNQPIILAAHRWGYLEWSPAFRKLNSFYNLPNLAIGDKIHIIWEQKKYEYTVYSVKTDTNITDYNANLILYTCQLWNSPVRFFIYANRSY